MSTSAGRSSCKSAGAFSADIGKGKGMRLPAQVTLAYLALMGLSRSTAMSSPLFPGCASSFLFLRHNT